MTNKLPLHSISDSDTLAPFHYFREYRAKTYLLPEEKLMFAVLNDAIDCLAKYRHGKSRRAQTLYREARNWIVGDAPDETFSFSNICETLNIDPSYLRVGLLRWLDHSPTTNTRLRVWRTPIRYRKRLGNFQLAS